MTCKTSKVRPQIKSSSFHMCCAVGCVFLLVVFLGWCFFCVFFFFFWVMHHYHKTITAISQGLITLWAGVKERQPHGISLKTHASKISQRSPWNPLAGGSVTGIPHSHWLAWLPVSACLFPKMEGAGCPPDHWGLLSLHCHECLVWMFCIGVNQPVSSGAAWYLFCSTILKTGN